jgi:hypothetical protein
MRARGRNIHRHLRPAPAPPRQAAWLGSVVGLVLAGALGLGLAVSLPDSTPAAKASAQRLESNAAQISFWMSSFHTINVNLAISSDSAFSYHTEFGPTTSYGSTCCTGTLGQAENLPNASTAATGLPDGATYHLRVVASNGTSTWYSNDISASTLTSAPPFIDFWTTPGLDTACGCFSFTIQTNTKGYDTTWYAAAGGDLSAPSTTPSQVIPADDLDRVDIYQSPQYVYMPVPLPPVVYLQLHASNAKGSSVSPILTYSTATTTNTGSTTTATTTTPPSLDEQRPTMTSTVLPNAYLGKPYTVKLPISNGSPPYTVQLNGNDVVMPVGLQLSPDGVVNGTPTSLGTSQINIRVFDQAYPLSSGGPASVFPLTLNVVAAPADSSSTTNSTPTPKTAIGRSVRLAKRTKTRGCTRGVLPDRQCSPGAYYSGLTKAVLCSSTFRTSTIRNVPQSEKYAVEREYGMPARLYGRTLEIDHIVSLELGGSNDIANLFPEPGAGTANYHVKDKLENKLHGLICAGTMTLHAAQSGIAGNWKALYKTVYAVTP